MAHVAKEVLLRETDADTAQDCERIAYRLAQLAEIDARKLYAELPYQSMFAYCVGRLHLSEDSAAKRIQAARTARQFPILFEAIADGRLHLSAVCMLASRLAAPTIDGLVVAATHKSKSEIELLLAHRFPKQDIPTFIRALPLRPSDTLQFQHAPGHVDTVASPPTALAAASSEPSRPEHAPGHVALPAQRTTVTPLAPQRFALKTTIDQETRELLRRAQELMGHQLPSAEIAEILRCSLKLWVAHLERRKFAATANPRLCRGSTNPRYVPADVKRAVRERDGDRCTFVSDCGVRCESRTRLEFDHVNEVARGGLPTVDGVRLRCRTHNQYTAERTFGREFMSHKRREAMQRKKRSAS